MHSGQEGLGPLRAKLSAPFGRLYISYLPPSCTGFRSFAEDFAGQDEIGFWPSIKIVGCDASWLPRLVQNLQSSVAIQEASLCSMMQHVAVLGGCSEVLIFRCFMKTHVRSSQSDITEQIRENMRLNAHLWQLGEYEITDYFQHR